MRDPLFNTGDEVVFIQDSKAAFGTVKSLHAILGFGNSPIVYTVNVIGEDGKTNEAVVNQSNLAKATDLNK